MAHAQTVGYVIHALALSGARTATAYVSPTLTMRATRQGRPNRRNRYNTFIVTIGSPNYAARQFIKAAKKAGEPFPIRKVQLKFYPEKKSKSTSKAKSTSTTRRAA